ncbi:MAG: (d)CMP kinase [Flavobacteriaceae bacterium]|jgi:cytidylate kinase|nr:(d)CMP kinase [Flavobacteriaceae bacterium]RKW61571.1 MAG: (d)CMP kinase [Riemerella sp.]
MNKKGLVIAIDGFSSTGKSSISKVVADTLGLIHIDTGAMYRAITLFGLRNFKNEKQEIDLSKLLQNLNEISLEFRENSGKLEIYLNGENVSKEIRTTEVSDNVSFIAKQPEVRERLVVLQRDIAEKQGVIMDGRDIGTVVLPNADYKFFLTASADERARRRFLELQSLGIETTIEEVKQNLIERDRIDSEREISPLKQAEDAILIDNTNLNKEETIDLILSYIKK